MTVTSRINATVRLPDGQPLPLGQPLYVLGLDDSATPFPVTGVLVEAGRLVVSLPEQVPASVGLNLTVIAPNCQPWTGRALTPVLGQVLELTNPESKQTYGIDLKAGTNPFRARSLPRLVPTGQFFVLDNGQPFTVIECSDFRLYELFLRGQDITPVLEQRASIGFNMVRVFGMGVITFSDGSTMNLQPQAWPGYYTQLSGFFSLLAEFGLYGEFTAFAAARATMPLVGDQFAHWARLCTALQPISNLLLELVNEADAPSNYLATLQQLPQPDGIVASHGSNGSDEWPVSPYWRYISTHPNSDRFPRETGHIAVDIGSNRPCTANETKRAPDSFNSLTEAYDAAASGSLLCAGSCFHSVSGRISALWSGLELEMAQEWVRGAKSVPLTCQQGGYRNLPLPPNEDPNRARYYQRGNDPACLVHVRGF